MYISEYIEKILERILGHNCCYGRKNEAKPSQCEPSVSYGTCLKGSSVARARVAGKPFGETDAYRPSRKFLVLLFLMVFRNRKVHSTFTGITKAGGVKKTSTLKNKDKKTTNKSWESSDVCERQLSMSTSLVQMKSVMLVIWLSFLSSSPLWSNKAWATPKLFSFGGLTLISDQHPDPIHVGAILPHTLLYEAKHCGSCGSWLSPLKGAPQWQCLKNYNHVRSFNLNFFKTIPYIIILYCFV